MTPQDLITDITRSAAATDAEVRLAGFTGTWRDILAAARKSAHWLAGLGIGPGDVVAVVSGADLGTVAAILGTWYRGATVTVLAAPGSTKRAHASYPEWLDTRLRQLGAALLVGTEPTGHPGPHEVYGTVSQGRRLTGRAAILQLTSGSTGEPKIVPVTADAVRANVAASAARFGLSGGDSVVSWLPLNHDMGLIGTLVLPALHGLALRLSTPDSFVRSPMSWLLELSDARATLTFAPHFAYGLIARYGRIRKPSKEIDLSALRHCVNGSEPINGAEFAAFADFAAEYGMARTALRPGYGMAELGLVFSLVPPGDPVTTVTADPNSLAAGATVRETADGSTVVGCGTPLDGYRVSVRSDTGAPLPDGTVGELCVHGPSLFPGYLGLPRDPHFWPDGFYRTGDLGFLHRGEVVVCGRIKDVIIIRGENLVPQDIEREVATVAGVRAGNVAAFGVDRGVVVVAETSRPARAHGELRSDIARRVRDSIDTRPADVVLLSAGQLPKTTSGKLQRQHCRSTYLAGGWSR